MKKKIYGLRFEISNHQRSCKYFLLVFFLLAWRWLPSLTETRNRFYLWNKVLFRPSISSALSVTVYCKHNGDESLWNYELQKTLFFFTESLQVADGKKHADQSETL